MPEVTHVLFRCPWAGTANMAGSGAELETVLSTPAIMMLTAAVDGYDWLSGVGLAGWA
jgi:hypothetical protein